MSILCKVFGHSWAYSFSQRIPIINFRTCTRCAIIQEHKRILHEKCWVTLVSRTKKGAKEYFRRGSI